MSDTPTIDAPTLKRYLERRCEVLELLRKDAHCRPFSTQSDANGLVIAVDWSEIHAYAFAGPPSPNDWAQPVLGIQPTRAIHQVALSVLFDRLCQVGEDEDDRIRLLLLPPYVSEMVDFMRVVREHDLENELTVWERESVLQALEQSDARHQLFQIAQACLREGDEEALDSLLREHFASTSAEKSISWVEEEFGSLYLLAKVSALNVMGALNYLTSVPDNGARRVGTLADCSPQFARVVAARDLAAESRRWEDTLLNHGNWKPGSAALQRDAEATFLLGCLNGQFHADGRQLLFATRGRDMNTVMSKHKGLFGCLSDQYMPSKEDEAVPIIARSWHHFFELGVAVVTGELDRVSSRLSQRLDDVHSKLETLKHKKDLAGDIYRQLLRETDKDFQNVQSLLSTEQPWLPTGEHEGVDLRAVRVFVSWVTDPSVFGTERSNLRDKMRSTISNMQTTSSFEGYAKNLPAVAFPDWYKPLTRALLEKFTLTDLSADVRGSQLQRLCSKQYHAIRDGLVPKDMAELSRHLSGAQIDAASDEPRQVDLARLAITAAYACGAFHRLKYLIAEFGQQQTRRAYWTPRWLILKIMQADVAVARREQANANVLLREAWLEASAGSRAQGAPSKYRLGMLNSWLLLHLDWTERTFGENLLAYPRWGHGKPELQYIMEQIEHHLGDRKEPPPSPLARAIRNNLVYTVARLTPIIEEGAVSASIIRRTPRGGWVRFLQDPMTTRRISAITARGLGTLGASELDTLGYYRLKLAYWLGITREGAGHAKEAERLFKLARKKTRRADRVRITNAVREHERLLEELRRIAKPLSPIGGARG